MTSKIGQIKDLSIYDDKAKSLQLCPSHQDLAQQVVAKAVDELFANNSLFQNLFEGALSKSSRKPFTINITYKHLEIEQDDGNTYTLQLADLGSSPLETEIRNTSYKVLRKIDRIYKRCLEHQEKDRTPARPLSAKRTSKMDSPRSSKRSPAPHAPTRRRSDASTSTSRSPRSSTYSADTSRRPKVPRHGAPRPGPSVAKIAGKAIGPTFRAERLTQLRRYIAAQQILDAAGPLSEKKKFKQALALVRSGTDRLTAGALYHSMYQLLKNRMTKPEPTDDRRWQTGYNFFFQDKKQFGVTPTNQDRAMALRIVILEELAKLFELESTEEETQALIDLYDMLPKEATDKIEGYLWLLKAVGKDVVADYGHRAFHNKEGETATNQERARAIGYYLVEEFTRLNKKP